MKVKGSEVFNVDLSRPKVFLDGLVNYNVSLKVKSKGFINTKYTYEFSEDFSNLIRVFGICAYLAAHQSEATEDERRESINEIEKALALFMFDSLKEVTAKTLKKQRNTLIKAFHPDKGETNEAYSQKINAAYELLSKAIKE